MNILPRIKKRFKNKQLLKLVFNDMYSIYTDALDKGSSISIIELDRAIDSRKAKNTDAFSKVYNSELNLLRRKLVKNKRGANILCSDLVKEIYKTYGIFEEALK